MSTTPQPTPSAGAVRAAEAIIRHNIERQAHEINAPLYPGIVAEIIDRETGARRLAEALRHARNRINNGVSGIYIAGEIDTALAAWEENNQSTNQTP